MEEIIKQVLDAVGSGGPLAVIGWGLFALERFYVASKREEKQRAELAEYKAMIEQFRKDHKETSDNTVAALHKLTTLLEVVRDRAGRS